MINQENEQKSGFPENEAVSSNFHRKEEHPKKRKSDKNFTEHLSPSHGEEAPQPTAKKRKIQGDEKNPKEHKHSQLRRSPRKQQQQNSSINITPPMSLATAATIATATTASVTAMEQPSLKIVELTSPQEQLHAQQVPPPLQPTLPSLPQQAQPQQALDHKVQVSGTVACTFVSTVTSSSLQASLGSLSELANNSNIKPIPRLQNINSRDRVTIAHSNIHDIHDDEAWKLQEMKEKREIFWKEDELTPNISHQLNDQTNPKDNCEALNRIMNSLDDCESTPEKNDPHTLSAFLQLSSTTKTVSFQQTRQKENKLFKNLQLIAMEAEKSLSSSTSLSDTKVTSQSQHQLMSAPEMKGCEHEAQSKEDEYDELFKSLSEEEMKQLSEEHSMTRINSESNSLATLLTLPSGQSTPPQNTSSPHLSDKILANKAETSKDDRPLQFGSPSPVQQHYQPQSQTLLNSENIVSRQQKTGNHRPNGSQFQISPNFASKSSHFASQPQKIKEPPYGDTFFLENELEPSLQPSINHSYDKICSNQTKNQTVANLAKPTTEPKVAPAASIENSTSTCGAPVTSSANESSISSLYRRLIVLDVEDTANEKKLRMYDEKNPTSELYIFLRDDWKTIHVYSGDIANIIGRPEAKSDPNAVDIYIVDRERNVFILHPDVFVTGSTLGESFQCVRRAVLGAKVKSKLENPRALYGKLNHEIFQRGISLGDFTSNTLNKYVDNLVVAFIESIYALGMSENEIRERLHKFLPSIQSWGQKYFKQPLTSNANCFVDFIPSGTKKYKVSVKQALKTEENIWSLMYGIKGNIDVSVEAFLQILQRTDKIQKTVYLPLELKTGSLDPSHCTQIIIYALLMMDRYNIPVPAGFLVSLEKNRMLGISVTRDRVQEALIKRNEVAYYLTIQKLPPILRQKHICNSCYAIDTCAIYHKALEKGTYESSLLEKFNEKTQYLTDKSCDFLKHWEELLDLEAQEVFKINKEIWSMDSTTREKLGRCLGQMIIDNVKKTENDTYIYCFKKANGNTSQRCTFNILDIQINPGDQVVLRGEEKNVGIATGTVIEVTSTHITVELPSELKVPLSAAITTNMSASQRFPEIGDIEDLAMARNIFREISGSELELNFRWRIDKDELISGFSYARTNLLKLFQAENGDEKRRRLIVDLEKPLFTTDPVKCHSELLTQNRCKFGVNLNPDQERAVLKILSAQDYALILGMPGTGKTTTIAHIVSLLVSLGKSVLLSAYTHSAVDNLLLKLKAIGIPFLRLGSKHQVHPELHRFIFNFDGSLRTVKDIEKKFNEVKVVALTCMSVGHILLQRQKFDYCIVDEASQLTLPICLGPISLCKIFVLVGDIYQLPPLVRSNEAKRKGLDVSLFKYLAEAHPQAVVTLEYQYRMNEDIMTLSNTLIYHNRLRCGTPQVAHSTLELSPEQLPRFIGESLSQEKHDWIREILKPTRRVVFLNTDEIPAPEIQIGDLVKNVIEASLVATFTAALVDVGVNPSAIGIISPWRSQLKEIRQQLGLHSLVAIEVHTVDKYQGRDKDCVIISLVRNNAKRNVGNLLRDWHRVNVAFTRAKKKLIVFGSRSTLCGNHLFQSFLELIDRRGWCYNLPKDAHTLYQRREHVFSNSQ